MSRARHRAQMLWCVATDATFVPAEFQGRAAYAGRCVHCNAQLVVTAEGDRALRATLEHIVPRGRGGADALDNLALACGRCNGAKGVRHDPKPRGDPDLEAMIERLRARKAERLREPPAWITLPPNPDPPADVTSPEGEGDESDATSAERKPSRGRGRRRW